jgi:GDPmannose 4,6-dehydratase
VKTAVITGVTGQDGFHLSKLLVSKNYRVVGISSGSDKNRLALFESMFPTVQIIRGDFSSPKFILEVIEKFRPNEIYNLAAISSVARSFTEPELTQEINFKAVVSLVNAIYSNKNNHSIKFYHSSSSEMYGETGGVPISEETEFNPKSPYGESKVAAFEFCKNFASNSNHFISQGILFNHESEFRQTGFVAHKIISGLIAIKKGELQKLKLGNLSPKRDWGYAGDYVNAIHAIVQQDKPSEFVIASGKAHSIEDFIRHAISSLSLSGDINSFVIPDADLFRSSEIYVSVGDASKAREILNWRAKYNFSALVDLLVAKKLELIKNFEGEIDTNPSPESRSH